MPHYPKLYRMFLTGIYCRLPWGQQMYGLTCMMDRDVYFSFLSQIHYQISAWKKVCAAVGLTTEPIWPNLSELFRKDKRLWEFTRRYQTMNHFYMNTFLLFLLSLIKYSFLFLLLLLLLFTTVLGIRICKHWQKQQLCVRVSTFPTGQSPSAKQNHFNSLAHQDITGFSSVT